MTSNGAGPWTLTKTETAAKERDEETAAAMATKRNVGARSF